MKTRSKKAQKRDLQQEKQKENEKAHLDLVKQEQEEVQKRIAFLMPKFEKWKAFITDPNLARPCIRHPSQEELESEWWAIHLQR